jgi:TRAP-type C4-dicarboxylate transport system permease large subunit
MIVLFLLVFGCVLEAIPIMILTVPIFMPIVETVGIDPIHFGVVMVLVLMIGLITPPVGMILFVISEVGGVSVERVMRTIIPFILPLLCVLALITFIPGLVLVIPNWVF